MLADDLIAGAKGAASYSGLSERTIYHLVEMQRLPVTRMGARLYFRKSELEKVFSTVGE